MIITVIVKEVEVALDRIVEDENEEKYETEEEENDKDGKEEKEM